MVAAVTSQEVGVEACHRQEDPEVLPDTRRCDQDLVLAHHINSSVKLASTNLVLPSCIFIMYHPSIIIIILYT